MVLTAITGVLFRVLDEKDIKSDRLLDIHTGHFGPIHLQPSYADRPAIGVLRFMRSHRSRGVLQPKNPNQQLRIRVRLHTLARF